uniref:Fibronectin type-III domain-containing protein n=1 Tax=Macrostomum lignano TaxID=282301 RepID=A0A1I8GDS6_9PLAT
SWTDQQADQPSSGRRIYEVEWSLETAEQQPQPQTPSSWRLNTSELSARLVGLRPSTAYSVRVRCLALASDQTVVPSSFSLRASFSTEPEAPGSPPRDLKISRSTLPMSVMLSWLPPLEPNGKITKYTVLYRPVSSNSAKPAGSEHAMPTAETQVVITGLRPSTHYYFRVRAGNSEGFGPDSDAIEFMMPDSSGQGGGVVYNTDSVLQRDLSDGAESDGLSSRRWWLLIGGVFGLALLLLAVSTAVVCMCQQRRPRRSADSQQRARGAKESASLIGGGPEQQQQQHPQSPPHGSYSHQQGGQRLNSVASPPRVDAPDFSSPGKLSSPHSSLSSSIGSASKQRHAAAAGSLMSTSTHSRPYPAPDILSPASGQRQHQQQHPHQQQQQLRNSQATVGSLTLESQNSRNFNLSTEDMDMTKTLDGLIQDLKGLTTREFEC